MASAQWFQLPYDIETFCFSEIGKFLHLQSVRCQANLAPMVHLRRMTQPGRQSVHLFMKYKRVRNFILQKNTMLHFSHLDSDTVYHVDFYVFAFYTVVSLCVRLSYYCSHQPLHVLSWCPVTLYLWRNDTGSPKTDDDCRTIVVSAVG